MSEIYEPAEDSYLMREVLISELPKLLGKNSQLKLLEVGCGSGINLQTVKDLGMKTNNITGSDINKEAVEYCNKLGFKVIESYLFEKIKGKFDLIIFNPPYLPKDEKEPKDSQIVTTGGDKGNELIIRFLKEAKDYLNKKGKIFLITSSLSSNINFNKLGYIAKELSSKKLFFEKLFCWECLKN